MSPLSALLKRNQASFHPILSVGHQIAKFKLLDLSEHNKQLPVFDAADDRPFFDWIEAQLQDDTYLLGGYGELRTMYARSHLFDAKDEPRRFHLGLDIWGHAGTPVYAFLGGTVHSLAYNEGKGNYGATLIMSHQLEGLSFYVLYGHISMRDIEQVSTGQYIPRGSTIAHLGEPHENGNWPPHLHLQIIEDIGIYEGDYPGVCKYTERNIWLRNSPDPNLIAQLLSL
jgi:murein DD-endopeptidase MepM/ murein hydrolase activator NlpD